MPSPFPGMDPYLEDPARWPDVHHSLVSEIRAELNQKLRPRYFARVEERVYVSDESNPDRVIIPDVFVTASDRPMALTRDHAQEPTAIDTIEPVEVTEFIEEEVHEAFIEIIDAQDRSVVCAIEVLSPANKVRNSAGQRSFRNKRMELLRSSSHFLEIDLLRAGERTPVKEVLPPHDYLVILSRASSESVHTSLAWPIPLPSRLPTIPVPLRGNDADVTLDLQIMLNQVYDRGAYDLDLNYSGNPLPPLSVELNDWARKYLGTHSVGKRTA